MFSFCVVRSILRWSEMPKDWMAFPLLLHCKTAKASCGLRIRILCRKAVSDLYFDHITREPSSLVRDTSHFTHLSPKENTRILWQYSGETGTFWHIYAIPLPTKTKPATVMWTSCSVIKSKPRGEWRLWWGMDLLLECIMLCFSGWLRDGPSISHYSYLVWSPPYR